MQSRIAVMTIMGITLQLLIYFSARVSKQSSSLKMTVHFFLEIFSMPLSDLKSEPVQASIPFRCHLV